MLRRTKAKIREEIATAESKLLQGNFSDYTGAMVLVERRRTLLKVVEIVNEVSKLDEDENDG